MISVLRTAAAVSFATLRLNPLRSVLSTLGVIIGVAALVAVLSLGDGMEVTMREQLAQTTDVQALNIESRMREEVDRQAFPLPDTVPLSAADLAAVKGLAGVEAAVLVARGAVEIRSADSSRRRMASVAAVTDGFDRLAKVDLFAGRLLAARDSGVAVISQQLAVDLAPDPSAAGLQSVIGDSLLVAGSHLQIVGLLRGSVGPSPRVMIVPFNTASQVNLNARFPSLMLRARRVEDVVALDQSVRRVLASRYPNAGERFAVQTYRGRAEQAAQGIFIFKLLMGAITGISLLVGGIGIMNVLLAAVSERTREIGIRRASGARKTDIVWQFLAESVTISGIGAMIGLLFGLTGAYAVTALIRRFARAAFVQASFSWSSLLVAAVLSVAIGLAFGTYPARRAANLSPIDAIRHE